MDKKVWIGIIVVVAIAVAVYFHSKKQPLPQGEEPGESCGSAEAPF